MLTHQKRTDYLCFHPGCKKIYCSYRSLKRHCAMQHGTRLLTPSSQPSALNTQPCPPLWEPSKLPAVKDIESTLSASHSNIPPPKSDPFFQFEGNTSCGTSYTNYTLAKNFHLSGNSEDPYLSQGKLPVIPQSLSPATFHETSHSLESATDLSASYSTMMSNLWASSSSLGSSVVGPVEPETIHTWRCNLDYLVTNPQTYKDTLSVQPSKKVTDTGMGSLQSLPRSSTNQPILLKLGMKQHEPQYKQQASHLSGEASCSTSTIIESSADKMEPVISPLLPAPMSKDNKKKIKKKILKSATVPTPPLPSPRPTTQRRPRPRPAHLLSPSQVVMAYFSKENAPADTRKVLQLHSQCNLFTSLHQ